MKTIDWPKLIQGILDRLILSQGELAIRCSVSQQTLSTWKTGRSQPGIKGKRQLIKLANDAGIHLGRFTEIATFNDPGEDKLTRMSPPVLEFCRLLQMLPVKQQRQVEEFARFKLAMWKKPFGRSTDG